MVATPEDNNLDPPSKGDIRGELRTLIDGLRDEVHALREEITALRQMEAPEGTDALLTRKEAAGRLRISTRTLDDIEADGEIQAVRIRGRVLYHPKALDAYIRQSSREGRE